jgi:putative transposase
VIGLFKAEVIRRKGPWRHLEAVELATLDWVDWFNHRRPLEPIGYVPSAEYEAAYYRRPRWPDSHQPLSDIRGTIYPREWTTQIAKQFKIRPRLNGVIGT